MQTEVVDQTMPAQAWQFDANVADAFDDMLRRSIPQYDVMRQGVFDIGCTFVKDNTSIIDLGCSRGEALAPFVSKFGIYNRYVGVEVSEPMLTAARERYQGLINCGTMSIRSCDLRHNYPPEKASLTLSILTLQFTPIEYRQQILRRIY